VTARPAVLLALVLAACGAKTGVSEPMRCDRADECPDPSDFCGETAACIAGRCAIGPARDCSDTSACTTDRCDATAHACVHTLRDRDGDGFGDASCGGDDCDDHDPASHPGAIERCTGGHDEDCDGHVDCSDSDCAADPVCAMCMPEVCSGGRDEDCDGMIDCADLDCEAMPPCCTPTEVRCDDGRDDDCDGRIDCLDDDCAHAPTCCVPSAELCNGLDDDCDGTIDDGVPCYFLDGAAIRPITTAACGDAWYAYDHPDGSSANPSPDVRRLGEVVVAIVASPASCGGAGVAVIADRSKNGTGGMLSATFSVSPPMGHLLQSDEPNECHYDPASGRGSCGWHWETCCTDGMIVGAFGSDFCMALTLTGPANVRDVVVLDGPSAVFMRSFGPTMMLCQRTIPAVP